MKTNYAQSFRPLNYLLFVFLATFFFSCDRSENSSSTEESVIQVNIPISAKSSVDFKSNQELQNREITFSGTTEHQIIKGLESADGMRNIKSIIPEKGSILSISNVNADHEINSLYFEWGYKNIDETEYTDMIPVDLLAMNYTLNNGMFELNFDDVSHQLLGNSQDPNVTFRFTISGNCSKEMNGIAKLKIPVLVESETISTRFELF